MVRYFYFSISILFVNSNLFLVTVLRFSTSAKQNLNIVKAMMYLIHEILKDDPVADSFPKSGTSILFYIIYSEC